MHLHNTNVSTPYVASFLSGCTAHAWGCSVYFSCALMNADGKGKLT